LKVRIAIGADHGGFVLKQPIIDCLKERNIEVLDFGTFDDQESVDYPDYVEKVCSAIIRKDADKGILLCGTGIGVSIAANKFPGIRAAFCTNPEMGRLSGEHNNANVIALGGRIIDPNTAVETVQAWLDTPFDDSENSRHQRRVEKINRLDKLYSSINQSKETGGCQYMQRVFEFDHPLIQHKISLLRDKNTGTKEFRELVSEVAMLMAYEVTRDLPLKEVDVETPVGIAHAKVISGKKLGLVPILRAGLGMVDGMLKLLPMAKVGHIGLYRDPETLEPVEYYCKLPSDAAERDMVVLDPMLATGGSASAAIRFLKNRGITNIKLVCLIAARTGVERINRDHPDVDIYCAAVDEELNDHAYIVPGLGDAGDRLFGTK
jgi:uracil phosphoribosyltransferase